MHTLTAIILGVLSTNAWAHKPSFGNDHSSTNNAYQVIDPDISIVLYAEVSCTDSVVWMEMETKDRDEIWVELGVPMLDRFEDYRPSMAIVGPGLPEASLPFEVPDGMGATVFNTEDVDEPVEFYEPFTQTESWILYQGWIDVPTESTVYLVAWDPQDFTGKLWVAVGKTEDFSGVGADQFGEWVEQTHAYYEFDDEEDHFELDCSLVAEQPNATEPVTTEPKGCGCAHGSSPAGGFAMFAGLLGLMLRRYRTEPDDLH